MTGTPPEGPALSGRPRFCHECGEPVTGRFCGSCGTPLEPVDRPSGDAAPTEQLHGDAARYAGHGSGPQDGSDDTREHPQRRLDHGTTGTGWQPAGWTAEGAAEPATGWAADHDAAPTTGWSGDHGAAPTTGWGYQQGWYPEQPAEPAAPSVEHAATEPITTGSTATRPETDVPAPVAAVPYDPSLVEPERQGSRAAAIGAGIACAVLVAGVGIAGSQLGWFGKPDQPTQTVVATQTRMPDGSSKFSTSTYSLGTELPPAPATPTPTGVTPTPSAPAVASAPVTGRTARRTTVPDSSPVDVPASADAPSTDAPSTGAVELRTTGAGETGSWDTTPTDAPVTSDAVDTPTNQPPPPPTADTTATDPAVALEAGKPELDAMADRGNANYGGASVIARLSARCIGQVDSTKVTADGDHVFSASDILAEARANGNKVQDRYLVLRHSKHVAASVKGCGPNPVDVYFTIADVPERRTKAEVNDFCATMFSGLSGAALADQCYADAYPPR